jgi:polyhydroxybutyrate depolymerase
VTVRWGVVGVAVGAIVLAAACRSGAGAEARVRTMRSGRSVRTYRVHRPVTLRRASRPPLVVMLHGGFGSGAQAEASYGWDSSADANGFVVAYPDGQGRAWNAGTCCGPPQRLAVDDVGFVRDLIHRMQADEGIDPTRVYVTGISNGAMLAYRVACELPHTIAAIGPVAGTMTVECRGATPTSVLHIHGLDDHNVPYEGGRGSRGVAKDSRPSVPDTITRWRQIDRCGPDAASGASPVRVASADCPNGRTVRLITIDGAGHQWPGSQAPNPAAKAALGLDEPSTALDATQTLWAFFQSKRR